MNHRKPQSFLCLTALSAVSLSTALLIAPCTAAQAQTTTFTDGTFANANWQLYYYDSGTGSSSAQQVATGGDPGAFRQVINVDNNDNLNSYSFLTAATIAPSNGAIISISGSFDFQKEGTDGQGVALALRQGGIDYELNENTDYPSSYELYSVTGLTAADFHVVTNSSLHPDFSTAGAPITFGFVNGNSAVGYNRTTTSDFDNYSVSVTQSAAPNAPEPSAAALLLALTPFVGTFGARRLGRKSMRPRAS